MGDMWSQAALRGGSWFEDRTECEESPGFRGALDQTVREGWLQAIVRGGLGFRSTRLRALHLVVHTDHIRTEVD